MKLPEIKLMFLIWSSVSERILIKTAIATSASYDL